MERVVIAILSVFSISLLVMILVLYVKMLRDRKVLELEMEKMNKEREQFDSVARVREFLPLEFFETLGIKRFSEIFKKGSSLKAPVLIQTVVMDFNMEGFAEFAHTMRSEEVFGFTNAILEKVIPHVYEKQGMVDKFHDGGICAFFQENYEDALVCAIAMTEEVNKFAKVDELYQSFSIALCYGDVFVGMVGNDIRMSVLTISLATGFASFLQSICHKYYANILITGSHLLRIQNVERKFHYRKVGYIYVKVTNQMEEIYDVFDGDEIEIRNTKRKTRIVFEKGVAYFVTGELAEARRCFIEVLKSNGGDAAAKEYVSLCDKYMNKKMTNKQIFLEEY